MGTSKNLIIEKSELAKSSTYIAYLARNRGFSSAHMQVSTEDQNPRFTAYRLEEGWMQAYLYREITGCMSSKRD
ncbi:hypothetical protein E4P82_18710 [Candidatus Competibacter phosphatis]|uniref:Uncharacterized protein n=1 Tax=Candidatus Competibacter phosphatis TaxID=221280 RepID=A0ABX1TNN8_9GAMM|nr:hypothetical protein [Candidatus Competibacter phosphatis]NMQ21043.1 hypothetical protein [Candidatus Competibacter phosphatis]